MKKALTIGTILLLLLSITGCGGKTDTSESGNKEVENNKNTTVVVESPKLPTEYTNEELTELITVEGKTLEERVEHGVELYDFTKIEKQGSLIVCYTDENEKYRYHNFPAFGDGSVWGYEANEAEIVMSCYDGRWYKNKPLSDRILDDEIHKVNSRLKEHLSKYYMGEYEILSVDKTNEDCWKFVVSGSKGYIGYGYFTTVDVYPIVIIGVTKDLSVNNIKLLIAMMDYSINNPTDEAS